MEERRDGWLADQGRPASAVPERFHNPRFSVPSPTTYGYPVNGFNSSQWKSRGRGRNFSRTRNNANNGTRPAWKSWYGSPPSVQGASPGPGPFFETTGSVENRSCALYTEGPWGSVNGRKQSEQLDENMSKCSPNIAEYSPNMPFHSPTTGSCGTERGMATANATPRIHPPLEISPAPPVNPPRMDNAMPGCVPRPPFPPQLFGGPFNPGIPPVHHPPFFSPPIQMPVPMMQIPGFPFMYPPSCPPAAGLPLGLDPFLAERASLWSVHVSPDGKNYYYNAMSKISTWDKPEELIEFEKFRNANAAAARPAEPLPTPVPKPEPVVQQSQEKKPKTCKKENKEGAKVVKKAKPIASRFIPGSVWCLVKTSDNRIFFYNACKKISEWQVPPEVTHNPEVYKMIEDMKKENTQTIDNAQTKKTHQNNAAPSTNENKCADAESSSLDKFIQVGIVNSSGTTQTNGEMETNQMHGQVETIQTKTTKCETENNQTKGEMKNNQAKDESENNQTKGETENNQTKGETENNQTKSEMEINQTKDETENNQVKDETENNQVKDETENNQVKDETENNQTKDETENNQTKVETENPKSLRRQHSKEESGTAEEEGSPTVKKPCLEGGIQKCEECSTTTAKDGDSLKVEPKAEFSSLEEIKSLKDVDIEIVERLAAKERATTSFELRSEKFQELLKDKNISAFSTWQRELPKIIYDPRYLLLTFKDRKLAFETYVKARANDEMKENQTRMKNARQEFCKFVESLLDDDENLSYDKFERKYANDSRLSVIDKPIDRKRLFMKLSTQRQHKTQRELEKRKDDEKSKKKLARKEAKRGFKAFLEKKITSYHYIWKNVWKDFDLWTDRRYLQLDECEMQEMFEKHCQKLKRKAKESKDEKHSKKRKKEKSKEGKDHSRTENSNPSPQPTGASSDKDMSEGEISTDSA